MNEQQQGTWYLKIVKGPVPGQTFAIERSQVVVGRDPTCDIVIDAPSVSRRHAQLTYQTGWFYVQDLGSANGIVVDGKRVAGSQRIGPKQPVALSQNVSFLLEWVPSGEQTAVMDYATSATDPYQTPTAQWQAASPSQPVSPSQPPPQPVPQPASQPVPQSVSQAGDDGAGGGLTWLFVGCGVILVILAVLGVIAALMFTGVLPNPLATPTRMLPTATATALPPLSVPTLTPTTAAVTIEAATATPYPTYTPYPTATPTATTVPPTETAVPPTETPIPPTETPVPPTNTLVPPTPTATLPPPTSTPVPPTPTATNTPVPAQPLSIGFSIDSKACISKAQYRIVFTLYLDGGTGQYSVYRDTDEQQIYGPGNAKSFTYELDWGAGTAATGTFYVRSGGERAEEKFYVARPADKCQNF